MKLKQRNEERFEKRIRDREREESEINRQRSQQQKVKKQRERAKMARIKEIKAQRSQDYHELRNKRLKDERDRQTFKEMIVEENKKKHDIVLQEERRIARSLNRFEK